MRQAFIYERHLIDSSVRIWLRLVSQAMLFCKQVIEGSLSLPKTCLNCRSSVAIKSSPIFYQINSGTA